MRQQQPNSSKLLDRDHRSAYACPHQRLKNTLDEAWSEHASFIEVADELDNAVRRAESGEALSVRR